MHTFYSLSHPHFHYRELTVNRPTWALFRLPWVIFRLTRGTFRLTRPLFRPKCSLQSANVIHCIPCLFSIFNRMCTCTIQYNNLIIMLYSLYERCLRGIMVVVFMETNINKRWLIQLPWCFPAGASHRVNGYYDIPCNARQHIYLNRRFDVQSIALYCYESMCCILMSRSMHKQ